MKLFLLIVLGAVTVQAEQSQVLKDFSVGYTKFTADVYKELQKSNQGNFLVCPLSAEVILALSNYGAKGITTHQLSAALHLPEDKEKVKQIFQELAPYLQGNDNYTLTSANKIYLQEKFKIVDEFKSTALNVFKAEIQNIDFAKNVQAAAEMNGWVEKQTHNKITNLISEDDLDEDTRAVLINAMYFHGNWITKFKEEDTKKRNFHVNKKDVIDVDLMEVTERFNFYENSELNAKFLELPYEGEEVTMVFVLPNDIEGLSALEAHIEDVLAPPQFVKEKVHVQIPKFKIESKIEFKPILQAFGVEHAFEDYADFTGISNEATKITKIIQKTFIEVEEKGTTAAAATAVVHYVIRSGLYPAPNLKQFIANHPFIYYLKSPAGIMFVGRYVQN